MKKANIFFGMLPLTNVSLGIGLDLVAECAAHTPGGITLLR